MTIHFKEIPEENIQRLIDSKMLQYSCGGITLEHEALYDCVTSIDGPNDSVFIGTLCLTCRYLDYL